MNTLKSIHETGMTYFIKYGYEGTKLAHIAVDCGIKKQSLNYYYKNKEMLFTKTYELAKTEECAYITDFFATKPAITLENTLFQFLMDYKQRFLMEKSLEFLVILSFMPPNDLRSIIHNMYREYLICLEAELEKLFTHNQQIISSSVDDAVASFITLLDGLMAKLVYESTDHFTKALNASWNIYWLGLTSEKRNN